MNTLKLNDMPTDPKQISFANDCFEVVRHETVYKILLSRGETLTFTAQEKNKAEAAARRFNRPLDRIELPVYKRIKWR